MKEEETCSSLHENCDMSIHDVETCSSLHENCDMSIHDVETYSSLHENCDMSILDVLNMELYTNPSAEYSSNSPHAIDTTSLPFTCHHYVTHPQSEACNTMKKPKKRLHCDHFSKISIFFLAKNTPAVFLSLKTTSTTSTTVYQTE
jgi:hypothetical protein